LSLIHDALLAAALMVAQPAAEPVEGLWLTQDREGVIEIAPCAGAGALCGRIVGQAEPLLADGTRPMDVHGVPHCGLVILHDARKAEDGRWHGRITDPDDGSDWSCVIWVEGGALHLRGYLLVPLLGQTQIWHPYGGHVSRDCHMI
jgi:hypothetical protein